MPATRTSKTQRLLRAAACWIATGTVIVSPWLFGSAEPWAYLSLSALSGLATIIWLFAVAASRKPTFRVVPLSLLLVVLVAFTALQTIPMPRAVVNLVNPHAVVVTDAAEDTLEAIAGLRDQPAPRVTHALSVSPASTWRSLCLLIAYVGTFLVIANTTRRWRHITPIAGAVVVSGFLIALLALIHRFSGSTELLWIHLPRHGGKIFGPFTNRNHFAAHMNLLFGLAMGLFLSSPHISEMAAWRDWRDRLNWLSSHTASRIALTLFAVVLIGGAMCATLSRGGILSLAAGLLVGWMVVAAHRGMSRRGRRGVLAVALLVFAAMLWLASAGLVDRLGMLATTLRNPLADERSVVTLDTARIFVRCPLTGSGFGSFRHIFSSVQTINLRYRWLHAHNDWAQLFAEGGVLGAAAFICAATAFLNYVGSRFSALSERARLFVIGTGIGLCAVTVHSLVDYSLHKPANAFLLSLLAGITVAAVHLRGSQDASEAGQAGADHEIMRVLVGTKAGRKRPGRWSPGRLQAGAVRTIALVALLIVTVVLVLQNRALRGEMAFARFLYLKRMAEKATTPATHEATVESACHEADLVAALARHNPDALAEATATLLDWVLNSDLPRELRTGMAEKAIAYATVAVRGAPSDYLTWLSLARTYFALGMWDEAELALDRARGLVRHRTQVRMFRPEK